MSACKLHVGELGDDGTVSCDYRGALFVGSLTDPRNVRGVNDLHRTLLERDPLEEVQQPAGFAAAATAVGIHVGTGADWLVELVLRYGPVANRLLSTLKLKVFGTTVQARIGIWDD